MVHLPGVLVPAAVLGAGLVVEAALTALRHRSEAPRAGAVALARAGELAAFGSLAVTGIVEWGVRYHALAACLVVFALATCLGWALHRRGGSGRFRTLRAGARRGDTLKGGVRWRRSTPRLVAVGVLNALVFTVAAAPAMLFPQGARPVPPTGGGTIARTDLTLTDAARADPYQPAGTPRSVTVGVWYRVGDPEAQPSGRPLVVFSHGGLGVLASNESLYLELASHGYVVAAIGHPYQAAYVREVSGAWRWPDLGYLRDFVREDASSDPAASLALYRDWLALRTGDIAFVLDTLMRPRPSGAPTTQALETVRDLVDPHRVAVAGHSLGGAAAMAVGRLRDDVKAVVALEAPMLGDLVGVLDGTFVLATEPYPVRVLNLYSDATWSRLDELPQYAGNVLLLTAGPGMAVNHHVVGANHLSLTDLGLTSPLLTRWLGGRQTKPAAEALEEAGRVTLAFLDETLR